jgi:hypothetical protein
MSSTGHTWKKIPKTHCKHGHEFTLENTHIKPSTGERVCKECANAASKRWNEKHPDRRRATDQRYAANNPDKIKAKHDRRRDSGRHRTCHLLSTYNLSQERHDALLEKQNGVCAICKLPNEDGSNLTVDHDHNCCSGLKSCGECVRGLLCQLCNKAIGLLKDNVETIRSAAVYLEA